MAVVLAMSARGVTAKLALCATRPTLKPSKHALLGSAAYLEQFHVCAKLWLPAKAGRKGDQVRDCETIRWMCATATHARSLLQRPSALGRAPCDNPSIGMSAAWNAPRHIKPCRHCSPPSPPPWRMRNAFASREDTVYGNRFVRHGAPKRLWLRKPTRSRPGSG